MPVPAVSSDQHKRLIRWIQTLLWDPVAFAPSESEEPEVLRLKGIIWSANEPNRGWVLQGVRGVYELEDVSRDSAERGDGKIVVIGRFVQGLEGNLRGALASLTPI
jgi:G3E family GTPase